MKFAKTLTAAALLAAAGSANASINNISGDLNEAYLSAYDSTTGKTFTLDTGVSIAELVANVANTAYSLNFDLSADANWTNFITGANTSMIQYVVAVGDTINFQAAITGAPLVTSAALFFGYDTAAAIQQHATDINSKVVFDPAANLSTLVLDSEAPMSGQHGLAYAVWGGWIQDPQAAYGQSVGFQLGQMDPNTGDNIPTTFKGEWKLAGNSLTFAAPTGVTPPPAAVPLPAAVWMFGAGLMGVLRLNRRKSMAV